MKFFCTKSLMLAPLWLLPVLPAASSPARASDDSIKAVKAAITKIDATLKIGELKPSPVPELYAATLDGARGYVTADGRHFIAGDMFEVSSRRNLAEESRKESRIAALREIDDKDAIVFAPKTTKHVVTVFTDVDCGYCRKLHSEIDRYNELGIAVRYLAYPRSGPGADTWAAMEAVWCARDRRDALTRAKRGEQVAKATCATTPVATHYALGGRLGLQGTPTIILEDGRALGGYMEPTQLAALLSKEPLDSTAADARQRR